MGRVSVVQDSFARWLWTRIADNGDQAGTSDRAWRTREEAVADARERFPDDHLVMDGLSQGADQIAPPMPELDALTEADTMGLTH